MADIPEWKRLDGADAARNQSNIIVFPVANQLGAAAVHFADFDKPGSATGTARSGELRVPRVKGGSTNAR